MILFNFISIYATINAYPDIRQMLIHFTGVGIGSAMWCIAAMCYETNARRLRRFQVLLVALLSIGFLGTLIELLKNSLSFYFYVNLTVSTVLSVIFAFSFFYFLKLSIYCKRNQT
jgi:hypothetical protein